MTDEEIVATLKRDFVSGSPVAAMRFVVEALGACASQFQTIRFLHEAFPKIPLGILMEATTSRAVQKSEGLTDDEVDSLLRPWFMPGETH